MPRYEIRIRENGIPEEKPAKEKKPDLPKKKREATQDMPGVRQENETAVYRFGGALQMRYELEERYWIF